MSDDDLEAIRAKRMAQLQAGGASQGPSQEQQEEMRRQYEDRKNSILSQVLDQQARARLNIIAMTKPEKAREVEAMIVQMAQMVNIIAMTKPEKAREVEAMIVQMAQMGQFPGKLNEEQLKQVLEKVSEKSKSTTVKFDRRRAALDSDDD